MRVRDNNIRRQYAMVAQTPGHCNSAGAGSLRGRLYLGPLWNSERPRAVRVRAGAALLCRETQECPDRVDVSASRIPAMRSFAVSPAGSEPVLVSRAPHDREDRRMSGAVGLTLSV